MAFLWKQRAFRWLGSYQTSPETATMPSTHVSAGVQGIGTGNPGFSATAEKNWMLSSGGSFNAFIGVGYRTNSKTTRLLGGFKYSPDGRFSVGVQDDGFNKHPFATYAVGQMVYGVYLVDTKSPGLMVGARF
jgi:hypothetical protein